MVLTLVASEADVLHCFLIAGQLFLAGEYNAPDKLTNFNTFEQFDVDSWSHEYYILATSYDGHERYYKVNGMLTSDRIPFELNLCAQRANQ